MYKLKYFPSNCVDVFSDVAISSNLLSDSLSDGTFVTCPTFTFNMVMKKNDEDVNSPSLETGSEKSASVFLWEYFDEIIDRLLLLQET